MSREARNIPPPPAFLYTLFYFGDLYYRDMGYLLTEGPSRISIDAAGRIILNMVLSLGWFVYVGCFPSEIAVGLFGRTEIYPDILYFSGVPFGIRDIFGMFLLGSALLYFTARHRIAVFGFLARRSKRIVLPISFLAAYLFIICLGRIEVRGIERILATNSYYNYYFWSFFIVIIYDLIPFEVLGRRRRTRWLTRAGIFLAMFLIFVNAFLSFRIMRQRILFETTLRTIEKNVKDYIQKHAHEDDFSFDIAGDLKVLTICDWIKKTGDTSDKRYTYLELLYPRYYTEINPKYFLVRDQSGKWEWEKRQK